MSRRDLAPSWTLHQLRRLRDCPAPPSAQDLQRDTQEALLRTSDPVELCNLLLDALLGEPPF